MGQAKKQHIEMMNGKRCYYCNKIMTEDELNKEVMGIPIHKFKVGIVGCADCMAEIAGGN